MDLSVLSELVPRLVAMAALITLSAFFAGSETSMFSLTRGQRERLARSERPIDRAIAALLAQPRRLIATILLGNELINITFSSLATGVVEDVGKGFSPLGVTLATTAVTVPLLLLVGEILPKSVALAASESWARVAARPIRVFMWLATPARVVVAAIAGVVVRLLGSDPNPRPKHIDEAQFKALVEAGSEAGELEAAEKRLIQNVFAFGDRPVSEVMTPAKDVFSLSYELPLARVVAEIAKSGYSRVPIHRGKKQGHEVVGVVFAKDLVGYASGKLAGKTLKDVVRQVSYVPKTSKCAQVFEQFRRQKTHLALVVDEYGRQVGLVTMEDLLRELFGRLDEGKKKPAPPPGETAPPPLVDPPSGPVGAGPSSAPPTGGAP
jgi:putative hemolysin